MLAEQVTTFQIAVLTLRFSTFLVCYCAESLLVLLPERLEESLLLLARRMQWGVNDVAILPSQANVCFFFVLLVTELF